MLGWRPPPSKIDPGGRQGARNAICELAGDRLFGFHNKREIKRLKISYRRLDEAREGIDFVLSRTPEVFPLVPNTKVRRLKLVDYPGIPKASVWFTYDDSFVYLLSIEAEQ
jgi:hypothetical protein